MDERFTQSEGTNVYTGCELLVKGSLESGVSLLTGYPGSPISEVFDVLQRNSDLLKSNGIVAQIANNEALGIARLNGSQMAEMRAIAFMKSVGMHVASDSLAISNLAGTTGGAVVVVGDDTWSYSTQVPADSRVLARHLYMPLLEPSTWQELKNWVNYAFEISAEANLYTCYLTTQNQADGGGNVELLPNRYPTISKIAQTELDTDLISIDNRVLLPPDTVRIEVEMLSERFPTALETAKRLGLNQILYPNSGEGKHPSTKHKIGFVTAGFSYCYLEHALTELNLSDTVPILKLGMTHPIDQDIVFEFAQMVDEIYVVEEKRPVIENEIKAFLTQKFQEEELEDYVKVWGKQFPNGLQGIPVVAGLDTSILIQRLIPLFSNDNETEVFSYDFPIDNDHLEEEAKLQQEVSDIKADIPARTPTFCPGCPHRDSSSVLLEMTDQFMDPAYMQKHHDSSPVDLVFHGDIGCYSMLKYEPFPRLMHNLSAMTLGGGAGAGIDPFIVNKQVVFMGDSTFFHGGMSAISDSIKNNQDITYIILDNQTTAMTGHQPTPADELDILGNPTFAQDIEKVARGLSGGSEISVVRVNPEDRLNYKKYLEKSILKSGVKIIIADKECAITLHRRLRREQQSIKEKTGFLKVEKHINITPEVCEFCLECTKSTGCPALKIIDTDYGNKIAIDQSNCVTDGACARIKWACPSFEEVVVTRKRPPRKQQPIQQIAKPKDKSNDIGNEWEESGISGLLAQLGLDEGHTLPPPPPQPFDEIWSVYAAGVGGMGIGTISKILVVAGYLQGYDVHFCDRKGLAIRNGGVYTHVTYTNSGQKISPIIPYGKADLVLGLDILEAVRGISAESVFRVASSGRTDSVVNTAKTDTVRSLIGEDNFEIDDLEDTIKENTKTYFGVNLFDVSEQLFGTKLYANIMLLGVAFQRGLMPIALEPIQIALKQMVRRSDLQQNMNAFEVGRYLAVSENADIIQSNIKSDVLNQTYQQTQEEKKSILSNKFRGKLLANSYVSLVENIVDKLNLDETTNRSIAIYIYDLIQFEHLKYAQTYIEKIEKVYDKDHGEYNATKAAIKYLHKVMLIKDEVYVSHLLTSKEKLARDKVRYNIDEKNGDKIRYLHLNRPHFTVLGIDIQHDIDTRNWMLHVMKRMKFLRRWLSQWHAKEREFREWYIREVIDTFSPENDEDYNKHLQALECVENVRGYRQIRYPTMEAAKQKVEKLLSKTHDN